MLRNLALIVLTPLLLQLLYIQFSTALAPAIVLPQDSFAYFLVPPTPSLIYSSHLCPCLAQHLYFYNFGSKKQIHDYLSVFSTWTSVLAIVEFIMFLLCSNLLIFWSKTAKALARIAAFIRYDNKRCFI